MANKRELKRNINLVCIAASLYSNKQDTANSLIYSTVKMQDDFIRRISHPEPGMPAAKYYKKLREDLVAQICDIVDQINN